MPEFDAKEQAEIRRLFTSMMGASPVSRPDVTQPIPAVPGKTNAGTDARNRANQSLDRYQRKRRRQREAISKVPASSIARRAAGKAAATAGPLGAALVSLPTSGGGISITALTALVAAMVASRVSVELERVEAERADRGIDFFKQRRRQFTGVPFPDQIPAIGGLTLETIMGVTADEFQGMAMGMSDAWSRLVNGEGWNSFSRVNLFRNRQRRIIGDDVRVVLDTLRSRADRELRTDGQITLGWKKTGINGG